MTVRRRYLVAGGRGPTAQRVLWGVSYRVLVVAACVDCVPAGSRLQDREVGRRADPPTRESARRDFALIVPGPGM